MHNILVCDDEVSIRESFSLVLEGTYKILLAASGEAALKTITSQKVDLVFLDIRMPGINGLETLKRMKEIDPTLEVIMVTAVNDIQKASTAVKLGARNYVVKPFDVKHILKLTEQILRKKSILHEGLGAQKNIHKTIPHLIGQSEKIAKILSSIENLKGHERVLILGEAGTEKETLAELVHQKCRHQKSPFIKTSFSQKMTSPEIKSLLFGQERGASSVELKAQSGLLEQAKGGSIFINNVECLPNEILKVLSSKRFSRMGSAISVPIEAGLIGGGNIDMAHKNKQVFDFFEALIEIPPLRERISDIPLLVSYLFEKYSNQYKKEIAITSSVMGALSAYPWPGNIKEMEILIERIFLSHPSLKINLEDLPLDILLKNPESIGSNFLSSFEKNYIQNLFEETNRDKEKTALLLGVTLTFLETKI